MAALVAVAAPREAGGQNAGPQATAEALFDQGKAAMAAQNYAEACPKFFESNRLDAGIGTSLWLAECYEKNGQTASAWAEFREAAALAVKSSDAREKVARARALALEARLARLAIVVPAAARVPGLHVARDGTEVGPAAWGTAVPADPGPHTVVVSAPDHRTETLTVEVRQGPVEQSLEVPVLADAPPAHDVAGSAASTQAGSSGDASATHTIGTSRVLALASGAAGLAAVAAGTYFGLHAKAQLDASNANGHCGGNNLCDATGVADRASASDAATVSTVLFVVGGAAVAGGAVLWLTAPSRAPAPVPAVARRCLPRVFPWADPRRSAGGVVLIADF
jgi:serine/threonine-protein kinase